MSAISRFLVLCSICFTIRGQNIPDEKYGYVEIEPGGYMFYWFYGATNSKKRNELPIILWLAGGPGVGGSGYGNFAEFGPIDQYLNPRTNPWNNYVNILFIDNPYGAGYSYVTNTSLYTKTDYDISNNLLIMHSKFLSQNIFDSSWFSVLPYYVFGESYGGKMAYHFGYTLLKSIENLEIKMNLQGVLSCDGWIDPQIYMNNYGLFALSQSLINYKQKNILDNIALNSQIAQNNNNLNLSETYFSQLMGNLSIFTDGVNVYDFIQFNLYDIESPINDTQLYNIMNNQIKQNLSIIPMNKTWEIVDSPCRNNLNPSFMSSVIYTVNYLLQKGINCNVWNANLDLIVNNLGTLDWINNKLNWTYLNEWKNAERIYYLTADNKSVNYFKQKHKNFAMYNVLGNSGHEVPAYNYLAATQIMCDIVNVSCEIV